MVNVWNCENSTPIEELYIKNMYQAQERVITSHKYCVMQLFVPASIPASKQQVLK